MLIPALLSLWLVVVYLPFAMRTWRHFLVLCAAYLLMGFGVRLGVANFSAAEVPSALVMIGNFWLDLEVWVLPVPIIARAVVLAAKSLGLRGAHLVALNVVGFLALPGFWLGQVALNQWERRPAPAQCTERPISLSLAGSAGEVQWSQPIALYLGAETRKDGRYLILPAHRRSICRNTDNGAERLTIKALSVRLDRPRTDRCAASDIQPWEATICAKVKDRNAAPLPHDLVFFDPDSIRLGDFGIPKAATTEGYPLTEDVRLVSATNAEVGAVTAVCRREPYSDGTIRCQMRREIADSISLYWEIGLQPDKMDEGLLQAETYARSVCSSLFDLPGCAMVPGTAP